MPRVKTKTKNKGGKKEYRCSSCYNIIEPGEAYHEWSFRYGGTYRQHSKCGYPRRSQLTQSKMGQVYDAIETVSEILATDSWSADEIQEAMQSCGETIREVADEYEQASESFGYAGENYERYEMLDSWASDFEGFYPEDQEEEEDDSDYRDRIRDEVESILSNEPF